ncbi:MAG TPA: immunoglobulin domain-containing protein [Phycisphaerae bacterium]|nr:immunoglobulin domain-containing protein [Phycisphaerae bacterium]
MTRNLKQTSRCGICLWAGVVVIGVACAAANGAVTLLGVQYQQDDWFPEFNCIWNDKYYPTSCNVSPIPGCNVHVYLKNTGGAAVTVSSVNLAGYNLGTVLKLDSGVHDARSIYFYWDNPPQDILNAGEPVWYKVDPSTAIPAGGVAQVVVRLRQVPVTNPISMSIVTSGGTVNPSIAVEANAPRLASVGFSQDRTKVYLHWRRSGGAAPTAITMDGVDVTANATTVGDPGVNYAATVLSFATPLANMSYHVYQGLYADGKTATASLRTWVNKFIHSTYGHFDIESDPNYTIEDWIAESSDHSINNCQVSVGKVVGYMSTAAGAADCVARGYGYTSGEKFDSRGIGPDMFFINDEIDAEDANMERTFCGTGLKLPCGKSPMGILAMRSIAEGEALRALFPNTPTSINMNGTYKPENYYSYGQAVDILQVDPYYQRRLQDVYWRDQQKIPLYQKATYIYAVAKAVARAAEPNPSNVILYSCSWKCPNENTCDPEYVGDIWPYPTPESKRIEAYYALAAGTKGLCYWWFNYSGWPAHGLGDQSTQAARNLWKEIGLYGNEIKTIAPQLVTSHPVDMTLQGSSGVWAKALASGIDTMILPVVNDDYYNDFAGCHYTPKTNASLTATLPSWMQSPAPTAFEISPGGLITVPAQLNGSQLTLTLGTLNLTRMIVITNNPSLRATIQQRYLEKVQPGVCAFAPEMCSQEVPPTIAVHPQPGTICIGGSTSFTVAAVGSGTIAYQWQKNSANLTNGGHYAGCTTSTLAVSNVDNTDVANYRCVVSNEYGSVNSNQAALTVLACNPNCLTNLGFEAGFTSGIGNGWTKFIKVGNVTCSEETTEVHGGSHSQEIYSPNKNNDGGVYQKFRATPGQPYTVKAWIKVRSPEQAGNAEGFFGIDPTGGTDPNSEQIMWASKPWEYWSQDTWTVTAQSNHITVYLRGRSTRLNQTAYVWLDDVELAPGAPSNNTPQAPGSTSILWRWTDLTIETGYRVRDSGGADKSGLLAADTTQWLESSGLAPNTPYTRKIYAINECGESDGSVGQTARTLSVPPEVGSVTPSTSSPHLNENIVWTAVGGFGAGTIQYYRYAWDQDQAYEWTNLEPQWSSGTITTSPTVSGTWYLHVRGYNGDNVPNGTYDYEVVAGASAIVAADLDNDGDVDLADFGLFQVCLAGPYPSPIPMDCGNCDLDRDNDVDADDLGKILLCLSGASVSADPNCAD